MGAFADHRLSAEASIIDTAKHRWWSPEGEEAGMEGAQHSSGSRHLAVEAPMREAAGCACTRAAARG